jgi:phosphoribosylformylglycinamidine synthase
MDAKRPGGRLLAIGATTNRLGGSHYLRVGGDPNAGVDELPTVDLDAGPRVARIVHDAIRQGLVRSAHDASEGGLLPAAIEMAFAGGLGLEFDLDAVPVDGAAVSAVARAFAEDHSRYLLEVAESDLPTLERLLEGIPHGVVGSFIAAGPEGGAVSVAATELGSGREAAARFEEAWKRGCDR